MKKLLILLTIILITIVGAFAWWQSNTEPADSTDKIQKVFVIDQGESIRTIGNELSKAGLIKNPIAFFILVKLDKLDNKIQAGDHRLSPSMSLSTLTQNLTHGSLDYWITVTPGKRADEVADVVRAASPKFDENWRNVFVTNEGYLYPDTYLIPTSADPQTIVAIMRKNFDEKYASVNNDPSVSPESQVVTVASLVEREAKFTEDMPTVASVIYNRLKINMPLQLDSTIQYALGYNSQQKTWWKNNLTQDDLAIKSPYNTYLNTGLPPTPISNPGVAALNAAAHPANTQYLYYISDSAGHIHAAKTLDEHNANIQKYHVQ